MPLPVGTKLGRYEVQSAWVPVHVTRGGQRFLINTQMETTHSQSMMVILNWPVVLDK